MTQSASQSFIDKLARASQRNDSLLCVGLDPDPQQYPGHFPQIIDAQALAAWGQAIMAQTADLVCCYKPNFAFYEQHGPPGLEALQQTIAAVPDNIPVLLDVKRGDIGSTAAAYARAAFEVWGADAVTVNPYLGRDSVSPFLAFPGKMAFILCYTSNPSARTVQEFGPETEPLFEHIIRQSQSWGSPEQIGFVVGATQPHALARLRSLTPQPYWVLAPGIGAQGGDLATALAAGLDRNGSGLLVPVSRAVLYAPEPRAAAQALRSRINEVRRSQPLRRVDVSGQTELILQLHSAGCVQFGHFTLASGRQSPIYIDLRRLASRPALLELVARAYADLLRPLAFEHLAAVPYAALPIGAAVALVTRRSLIYPRKEVKGHGTGQTVEGIFASGDRAVIIEDLITSGGSILQTIGTLRAAGLAISDVVVLIDREEGGREALAGQGYRLYAVLTLSEILKTLRQAERISAEQLAAVTEYLNNI